MNYIAVTFCFIVACLINTFTQETSFTLTLEELNKPNMVTIPITNEQVIFARPNQKITLQTNESIQQLTLTQNHKTTPYQKTEHTFTWITPKEGESLIINIQNNNATIQCYLLSGIKDHDTEDGFVEFNQIKYPIGTYPKLPTKGKVHFFKESYTPPQYFFVWDKTLEEKPISKSLYYKDLVIKPDIDTPEFSSSERPTKIFTFNYETILNFEKIIQETRKQTPFHQISILSFYRTPLYNQKIKGSTFSRHIYGDGIDWYIDEKPADGIMDDLNQDQKVTIEDAKPFVDTIKKLVLTRQISPCGTGVYFTKKGASLHFDTRGHLARWGGSDTWWPDDSLADWLKEIEEKIKQTDLAK